VVVLDMDSSGDVADRSLLWGRSVAFPSLHLAQC
jgi:hypothetical protein